MRTINIYGDLSDIRDDILYSIYRNVADIYDLYAINKVWTIYFQNHFAFNSNDLL